jgi:3-oxoacyl-[acyl-carrier-protein] synthase-3
LAHAVQKQFKINGAKCFTIDAACSSFVNAIEIVECYFANKKTSKALIVISENNSAYSHDCDKYSGFLFGDGAAAVFNSTEMSNLGYNSTFFLKLPMLTKFEV